MSKLAAVRRKDSNNNCYKKVRNVEENLDRHDSNRLNYIN